MFATTSISIYRTLRLLAMGMASCLWALQNSWSQTNKSGPDVLILVQPQGMNALVVITYSHVVPHTEVKNRIIRLAAAGGWQIISQNIQNQDLTTSPAFGNVKRLGTQTGATILFRHAIPYQQGVFRLQPYVDTFSDLNHIELWFMMGRQPDFTGLRHYESTSLSVHLLQEGAPYRYRIRIRDRTGGTPILPTHQPPVTTTTPPARANTTSEPNMVASLAAVVFIAAAIGFVVLITLLFRARAHTVQPNNAKPRRASPP